MMAAFKSAASEWALPVLLVCVTGLVACGDSGNSVGHSHDYYHSSGFYDPYYYGVYDYDDYDPVIVPPSYNTGNKPQNPDRPGSGERPGNGLKPSHPIAGVPSIDNRPGKPMYKPKPSTRPSIPSRARPMSTGRSSGMRGGGGRGGGMRGGGGRR